MKGYMVTSTRVRDGKRVHSSVWKTRKQAEKFIQNTKTNWKNMYKNPRIVKVKQMRINYLPVDGWSIVHFVVAYFVAVYLPFDIIQFTLLNIFWELIEIPILRGHIPKMLRKHFSIETPVNTVMDIFVTEMGWIIGHFMTYGAFY